MYQLDENSFTMIFSHKWPLHVSDIYMSISGVLIYRLFHCYALTPSHVFSQGITPHAAVKQPIYKNSFMGKNHNKIVCIKLVHLPYL